MPSRLNELNIKKEKFNFRFLPDFAKYILENHTEEFVKIGIRFCREEELPLMKPLAKFSEEELIKLSADSNQIFLKALSENRVVEFVEENLTKYLTNQIGIIDKSEVEIADLTLAFYIRRKLFAYFIYGYTKNPSVQQSIVAEVDAFTSQEELLTLKAYMILQKEMGINFK